MNLQPLAWLGLLAASHAWCAEPVAELNCVTPIGERELLAYVTERIQPLLEVEQTRLELMPIGAVPIMSSPHVRLLTKGLRSRIAVELTGEVCGHDRSTVATVWFKARALREVWVYGRNARAEQAVAQTEPKREQVDMAALQISASDLPETLEGLWLAQAVNADMPILKRHLQAEPLVQRDAMVTVVVYGPGLMLRTQGKVMRSGGLGDSVPVLVEGAESSLLTVVAGKGEVHVQR